MRLRQILHSPIGPWAHEAGVVFWWPSPEVRLLALLDPLDERSAEALGAVLVAQLGPGLPRHASYVDVRGLGALNPAPFARFLEVVQRHRAALDDRIRRSALVHAGGLPAAASAGYRVVAGVGFDGALFDDPRAALSWLGVADPTPLIDGLQARVEVLRGVSDLRGDLVALLEVRQGAVDLEGAARSLGLSARTLQRRLRDAATSWKEELEAWRLQRARYLLRVSGLKVQAVAHEVGYRSSSALYQAFQRAGLPPPGGTRAGGADPETHGGGSDG